MGTKAKTLCICIAILVVVSIASFFSMRGLVMLTTGVRYDSIQAKVTSVVTGTSSQYLSETGSIVITRTPTAYVSATIDGREYKFIKVSDAYGVLEGDIINIMVQPGNTESAEYVSIAKRNSIGYLNNLMTGKTELP